MREGGHEWGKWYTFCRHQRHNMYVNIIFPIQWMAILLNKERIEREREIAKLKETLF